LSQALKHAFTQFRALNKQQHALQFIEKAITKKKSKIERTVSLSPHEKNLGML
jgi:hypothetical protein